MQSWSPRMRNPKYLMVYIARCTNESMQSWSPRIRNPKYRMRNPKYLVYIASVQMRACRAGHPVCATPNI